MSIIVLKRKFEAPPSKDEILSLLVGDNVGDIGKAKESLGNLLAPMKDLLALYQFMDSLDTAAGQLADLVKEHAAFKTDEAELAEVNRRLVSGKSELVGLQTAIIQAQADLKIFEDKKKEFLDSLR